MLLLLEGLCQIRQAPVTGELLPLQTIGNYQLLHGSRLVNVEQVSADGEVQMQGIGMVVVAGGQAGAAALQ